MECSTSHPVVYNNIKWNILNNNTIKELNDVNWQAFLTAGWDKHDMSWHHRTIHEYQLATMWWVDNNHFDAVTVINYMMFCNMKLLKDSTSATYISHKGCITRLGWGRCNRIKKSTYFVAKFEDHRLNIPGTTVVQWRRKCIYEEWFYLMLLSNKLPFNPCHYYLFTCTYNKVMQKNRIWRVIDASG